MIPRLVLILVATLFPALPVAAERFEYGPRPPLSAYDPAGLLDPAVVKEISDSLEDFHQKDGIDVILLVLDEIGNAPPEHVAGRFAEAWSRFPNHCVILHVPGRADSPWIFPRGRLVEDLDSQELSQSLAAAQSRAASQPDDAAKAKAAAAEATTLFRTWSAAASYRAEKFRKQALQKRLDQELKDRRIRNLTLATVAFAISLLAALGIFLRFRRRLGPRHFPPLVWQSRLCAPYAGGNYAVTQLGNPHSGQP
jgi:hypothetical protein